MRARVLAVVAVLALAMPAFGQDGKDVVSEGGVSYNRKTVINFEDDTIEGDLKRPDGEYVEARQKVDHSNLIRIREDWREKGVVGREFVEARGGKVVLVKLLPGRSTSKVVEKIRGTR